MLDPSCTILFVGESPPPGAPPDFRPFDCKSGDRLARLMLGLVGRETLLGHVPRANVFDEPGVGLPGGPKWVALEARIAAHRHRIHGRTIVALGAKVAEAFAHEPVEPMSGRWSRSSDDHRSDVIAVPHPSGRSTALTIPARRAEAMRAVLPEVVAGIPTLRAWDFRLDDPPTLAALGLALSPHRPELGAAVLLTAAEVHAAPVLAAGVDRRCVDEPLRVLANACCLDPSGGRAVETLALPRQHAATLRARAKAARADLAAHWNPDAMRATALRYAVLGVA